jgi:hypothetical protein
MNRTSLWLHLFLILLLTVSFLSRAVAGDSHHVQVRTWQTVTELSPQELRAVDLSTTTARHAQTPYLPAELYPFTPPYTAEEMGYRGMEFPQRPRWSCIFANMWGSISPEGVLFFLRPALEEGKFPDERPMRLSADMAARIQAQEVAGRLVFELEHGLSAPTEIAKPTPAPLASGG